jgi:lipopolysaccharide/colanic/teichoic acid biosynthesis glycosyltransferase
MKRAFDLLISALALLVLSPMLGAIALWVVMDSRGGAFYGQDRIGKNGRPFRLFKFRSMISGSGGTEVTLGNNDSRITKAGAVLRRYKLDELPQLWNVIIGDMSIVGPRPEVPGYVALYTDDMRQVLEVRPGLTDPGSIAGFDEGKELAEAADPEAHYRLVILPAKVALQQAYLQNATFLTDIRVIVRTLRRIFKG